MVDVNDVCENGRNVPLDENNRILDVSEVSNHNKGCSETHFIDKLCNCLSKGIDWCFIHNTVRGDINYNNGLNTQFGFISQAHIPVPLFRPCDAHLLVAATGCPNYKLARVRVHTDLNIANWRALCVNYYDKLLLEYLEYWFPLCVNRDAFMFNENIVNHPSAVQFNSTLTPILTRNLKIGLLLAHVRTSPFKFIIPQFCQDQNLMTPDMLLSILASPGVKQLMITFQMKYMMVSRIF